jgi:predicted nucleic acid-binding protein
VTAAQPLNFVVDASVLVAYFVPSDAHHSKVLPYWNDLEIGQSRFHLPMLAVVETYAGIYRPTSDLSLAEAAVYRLGQLTQRAQVVQYPLDEQRTQRALSTASLYNLRGADAVYAALADELQLELLTADNNFSDYPKLINLA